MLTDDLKFNDVISDNVWADVMSSHFLVSSAYTFLEAAQWFNKKEWHSLSIELTRYR